MNSIKNGFATFLREELEIEDISVNGNKIICNTNSGTVVFLVTKNDIKYTIK